jgi:hypothetical protein
MAMAASVCPEEPSRRCLSVPPLPSPFTSSVCLPPVRRALWGFSRAGQDLCGSSRIGHDLVVATARGGSRGGRELLHTVKFTDHTAVKATDHAPSPPWSPTMPPSTAVEGAPERGRKDASHGGKKVHPEHLVAPTVLWIEAIPGNPFSICFASKLQSYVHQVVTESDKCTGSQAAVELVKLATWMHNSKL